MVCSQLKLSFLIQWYQRTYVSLKTRSKRRFHHQHPSTHFTLLGSDPVHGTNINELDFPDQFANICVSSQQHHRIDSLPQKNRTTNVSSEFRGEYISWKRLSSTANQKMSIHLVFRITTTYVTWYRMLKTKTSVMSQALQMQACRFRTL